MLILLSLPPVLFIVLTWLLGTYLAKNKPLNIAMMLTLGAIPIRFIFVLSYIGVLYILGINVGAVALWMCIIYSIVIFPEALIIAKMCH